MTDDRELQEEMSPEETDARSGGGEMSIEETLDELEAIIEKMEDRDRSLEETFALYERGMKLARDCSGRIEKVEKKIQILAEEGQNDEF